MSPQQPFMYPQQPVTTGRRSPSRVAIIVVSLMAVVVVALVAVGVTVARAAEAQRLLDAAKRDYSSAHGEFLTVFDAAERAAQEFEGADSASMTAFVAAGDLLVRAEDGLAGATEKAELAAEQSALMSVRTEYGTLEVVGAGIDAEELRDGVPTETEALLRTVDALTEATGILEERTQAFVDGTEHLDEEVAGVADAGEALMASLPVVADQLLSTYVSATNVSKIALIDAAAAIPVGQWQDVNAALAMTTYIESAHALQASQAAEDAEKAGDLFDRRVEVEAFARSIAGGVMLDFDWAPVVYTPTGVTGAYTGTATWNTGYGGFTTILLSDGIAADWGAPSPVAVVVHEVGHAIGAKCYDLQTSLVGDDQEAWATAWTLGMGYTANGNGVSIYGRPSDEIVTASAQCR